MQSAKYPDLYGQAIEFYTKCKVFKSFGSPSDESCIRLPTLNKMIFFWSKTGTFSSVHDIIQLVYYVLILNFNQIADFVLGNATLISLMSVQYYLQPFLF